MQTAGETAFQTEETARTKSLGWEQFWHIWRTKRRCRHGWVRRMVEGRDIRELHRGPDHERPLSYSQGSEYYSECDHKPVNNFKQRTDMIWRDWYDSILRRPLWVQGGEWIRRSKLGSKETSQETIAVVHETDTNGLRMMTMETDRSRWIQVEVIKLNEEMDWGQTGWQWNRERNQRWFVISK